jgi:hypothetical protein
MWGVGTRWYRSCTGRRHFRAPTNPHENISSPPPRGCSGQVDARISWKALRLVDRVTSKREMGRRGHTRDPGDGLDAVAPGETRQLCSLQIKNHLMVGFGFAALDILVDASLCAQDNVGRRRCVRTDEDGNDSAVSSEKGPDRVWYSRYMVQDPTYSSRARTRPPSVYIRLLHAKSRMTKFQEGFSSTGETTSVPRMPAGLRPPKLDPRKRPATPENRLDGRVPVGTCLCAW